MRKLLVTLAAGLLTTSVVFAAAPATSTSTDSKPATAKSEVKVASAKHHKVKHHHKVARANVKSRSHVASAKAAGAALK